MDGILDSMMSKSHAFSPESIVEYTALQLAKKLGDTGRLWKYVSLFDHHAAPLIGKAFSNAHGRGLPKEALIAAFEEELRVLVTREVSDAL